MASPIQRSRTRRDLLTLFLILGLLGCAYLLPPDTSLAQLRKSGVLRACVPVRYPPLVTGDPRAPGIDVELLQETAQRLDLRLLLVTNASMGQDFNPRNWRVTRAQCQIVAGGVVDSRTIRSFFETTPAHAETGWALLLPDDLQTLAGRDVAFHAGVSGLDRIALSRFLRAEAANVVVLQSAAELERGLASGRYDAGVTEALAAGRIAENHGWTVQWLPLERYSVVFGLWKGDLTLKRSVAATLRELKQDGTLRQIAGRYDVTPIEDVCGPCQNVDPGTERVQ